MGKNDKEVSQPNLCAQLWSGFQWVHMLIKVASGKAEGVMTSTSACRRDGLRLEMICSLIWFSCLGLSASVAADGAEAGPLEVRVIPAISNIRILPNTYPLPNYGLQEISIIACRGEYEPASFVLRATDQGVDDIQIESSDLVDLLSKKKIPKATIDIRVVKVWFQGSSAWTDIRKAFPSDFRQVMVPELLLRDDALVTVDGNGDKNIVKTLVNGGFQYVHVNPGRLSQGPGEPSRTEVLVADDAGTFQGFSLGAGAVKQVWITAHVPADAYQGDYIGKLTISSRGVPMREVQVRLRVLPFDLAQPRLSYSLYYRAQLRRGSHDRNGGSEWRTVNQMTADLEDMRAHGVNNPTMYQSSFDLAGVEDALRLRKGVGAIEGGVPLFYLGIQTTESYFGTTERSSQNVLKGLLPKVSELARVFGYYPTYIYGRDEAAGTALEAQRRIWSLVHQAGSRVFVAGSTGAFPSVGDLLDLFIHYGKPNVAEATQWHSQSKMIFNYANPQSGPENPYLFRLNYGLMLWAHSYDGVMPYAYQHCFGSCWNDVDHEVYRDHMLTYPTASGVIPTLAWEGFREAVDDVRYVSTLEMLLDDIHDSDRIDERNAKAALDGLRVYLRQVQAKAGSYNHDADVDLDSIRSTIQSHITKITDKNRELAASVL